MFVLLENAFKPLRLHSSNFHLLRIRLDILRLKELFDLGCHFKKDFLRQTLVIILESTEGHELYNISTNFFSSEAVFQSVLCITVEKFKLLSVSVANSH